MTNPNSPTFHYSLTCPCLQSQPEQATYKGSYKVWFTNKITVLLPQLTSKLIANKFQQLKNTLNSGYWCHITQRASVRFLLYLLRGRERDLDLDLDLDRDLNKNKHIYTN